MLIIQNRCQKFGVRAKYTAPLREKIHEFKKQILKAYLEKTSKNEILLPSKDEVGAFAQEVGEVLKKDDFNFKVKQLIVRKLVSKVIANQKSLQVYGNINLQEVNVFFRSEYRNCGASKRRQIDAF